MLTSLLELPTCREQLQKTKSRWSCMEWEMVPTISCVHLDRLAVPVRGIFASDGFVRGHSFHGKRGSKVFGNPGAIRGFCHRHRLCPRGMSLPWKPFFLLDQQYELYAPDVPVAGEDLFDRDFSFRICPRRRPPTAFGQTSGRGRSTGI